ncbi:hypothetical protein VTO58DRAFT_101853 [Aureobasidium pullulans]
MVSLNRRQVSVILSVLYLGALTAMAAYAVHQNSTLSLPIPSTLTTLTLALAPFAGLCIETSTALASSLAQHPKLRHRHARNFPAVLLPSTLTILGLLVYITVVATLSGTHISPAIIIVTPALHPTWAQQSMRHPHRMLQDESDAANRVIEYPSQRYTDDPEGGDEDARREIDGLNNESRLALEVESSRDHPSKLLSDQGVWRGEDGRT